MQLQSVDPSSACSHAVRKMETASLLIRSSVLGQVHGKSIRNLMVTKFGFYFAAQKTHPVGQRMRGEEDFLVYEIMVQ